MSMEMKCWFRRLMIVLLLLSCGSVSAQISGSMPISIQWKGVVKESFGSDTLCRIMTDNACYNSANDLVPSYMLLVPVCSPDLVPSVSLDDIVTSPLTTEEQNVVGNELDNSDFAVEALVLQSRDDALLRLKLNTMRNQNGRIEKLVSATINYKLIPKQPKSQDSKAVLNSVLSTGTFYKMALSETGIYRLTYNDLSKMGVDLSSVDPRDMRIYHNGGGVLPELNAVARHDDIVELPILVSGESDGSFDQNDYALFYARGPVTWKYNPSTSIYEHTQNAYDDSSYIFLTFDKGAGKRITTVAKPSGTSVATLTEFMDYAVHEKDEVNLAHAGRTYYGDKMDGNDSKTFSFNFPNLQSGHNCVVNAQMAGYNINQASFLLYANGTHLRTFNVEPISASGHGYGRACGGRLNFGSNTDAVDIKLQHKAQGSSTSTGYVDYITVNAWRKANFSSGQMIFRNPLASDTTAVYDFKITAASQNVNVWDVTNPVNPFKPALTVSGNTHSFTFTGNIHNEFIAFDGTSYMSPVFKEVVENQNLHSIKNIDYLIVSYKDFISQAERLKQLHAVLDPDMSIYITTPEKIYNEFSCGAKDVTAIRDFARHLYRNSSSGKELKYLLLLGDASYDYKNRNNLISDFVPAYESVSSLFLTDCYVSDTYFGFMDESEGGLDNSVADIGIGRLPVTTVEQAGYVVDKICAYTQNNEQTMAPWRNVVTFFADDDELDFMETPEMLIATLRANGGQDAVVDKIYLDAYEQISTPNGQTSPAATAALNNRVGKGTLVLNYTGHGGEVQLTEEKVLQLGDVQSWRNAPKYPLMITATCEFSRYDDLNRISLGENTFCSRHGGTVAMFTTPRPTYRTPNTKFNTEVYKHLFVMEGGKHQRLGDTFRQAKPFGDIRENNYVFFGDPAMRIAYPTLSVKTTKINGNDVSNAPDTLKALQNVTIAGEVTDLYGNKDESFNGIVFVSVYDKEATITTLGDQDKPFTFKLLNSQLFNGKTNVENGQFEVSFIMPRDIAFNYGNGFISYYATDYVNDANGSFSNFMVGGFDDTSSLDDDAPQIRLFIDDTLFVDGGTTNQNPILLACLSDKYGINTTGNGIGHDIVATLSGPISGQYRMNDFFESEINNQGKGTITYNFQNLQDGEYTLKLKVWNINNVSNEALIHFVVANNRTMVVDSPQNIPNPCSQGTSFVFGHNQTGNVMNVKIEIFNIMGQRVATMSKDVYGSEARTAPIYWDGCSVGGDRLAVGVYPYRITATNEDGQSASCTSRLLIIH